MNTATSTAEAHRRRLIIAAIPLLCTVALAAGMLIGTAIAITFGLA